jgi:hypothetical protein
MNLKPETNIVYNPNNYRPNSILHKIFHHKPPRISVQTFIDTAYFLYGFDFIKFRSTFNLRPTNPIPQTSLFEEEKSNTALLVESKLIHLMLK